jgi:hypothetical protein
MDENSFGPLCIFVVQLFHFVRPCRLAGQIQAVNLGQEISGRFISMMLQAYAVLRAHFHQRTSIESEWSGSRDDELGLSSYLR